MHTQTPHDRASLLEVIERRLPPEQPKSFSRAPKVRARLADVSNGTFYGRIASGLLPKGIPIGPNVIAWLDRDIDVIVEALLLRFTEDQLRQLVIEIHARQKGSVG